MNHPCHPSVLYMSDDTEKEIKNVELVSDESGKQPWVTMEYEMFLW